MNNQPLVSVMIPYYNCEQYISETIASVEKQTYPNIEIIIVNDGSSKDSSTFLTELLKNKPAICLAHQSNQGVAAARNHAARLANGQYFLFLDADDIILPDYIQKAVTELENHLEYKLVYPMAEFFDAQRGAWHLPAYDGIKSLLISNCFPSSISMHRSSDFAALNGFDESLKTHEDWDFWIRLLQNDDHVYQIPEVLFRYRKRKDGSSLIDQLEKNPEINRENWQRICVKHQQLLLKHQLGYVDLFNEINKLNKKLNILESEMLAFSVQKTDEICKLKQENRNLSFYIYKIQTEEQVTHNSLQLNPDLEKVSHKHPNVILSDIYKSPSYKIIRLFKKINWRIKGKPKKQLYYPESQTEAYLTAIKILASIEWSLLAPIHILQKIFKNK